MEFKEEDQIENANLVIDHFGYWPDFHDSEIISISFNRNSKEYSEEWSPSVAFQVYAFEMTNKLKGRHYKLIKHCIIDFELIGINNNSMDEFNHQNALQEIVFGQEGDWLVCELQGDYGVDARFTAKKIRVKSLVPVTTKSVT